MLETIKSVMRRVLPSDGIAPWDVDRFVEDRMLYDAMQAAYKSGAISKKQYRAYQEVEERTVLHADALDSSSDNVTLALKQWSEIRDVADSAKALGLFTGVAGAVGGGVGGFFVGAELGAHGGFIPAGIAGAATAYALNDTGENGNAAGMALLMPTSFVAASAVGHLAGGLFGKIKTTGLAGGALGAAAGGAMGGGLGGVVGGTLGAAKELVVDRLLGGNKRQAEKARLHLAEAFEIVSQPLSVAGDTVAMAASR